MVYDGNKELMVLGLKIQYLDSWMVFVEDSMLQFEIPIAEGSAVLVF